MSKVSSRERGDSPLRLLALSAVAAFVLGCPGFGEQDPGLELPDEGAPLCESVRVVLDVRCVHCHGAHPLEGAPEGIRFDIFEDTDNALGAGGLAESIVALVESGAMPPLNSSGGRVRAEEERRLRAWLDAGANYDACLTTSEPPDPRGQDAGLNTSDIGADAGDAGDVRGLPDVPHGPPPTLAQVNELVFASCGSHHMDGTRAPWLTFNDGLRERLLRQSVQFPSMPWVTPGDPDNSYLFHKINGTQRDVRGLGGRMPIGPRLDDARIDLVREWIEAGAPN